MKGILARLLAGTLLIAATAMTAFAASETNRVTVNLAPPNNAAHQYIYKALVERRVAERLQKFLSPFRLPRTLKYVVAECGGEDDAFYGEDTITICYEYVDKLFENTPEETKAAGVEPIDAVVGPFIDTCLHEFGHALFDMLHLPVLGREEDAADQVAAYIYLQLGQEEARRLIAGTAYAHLTEAESDDAPRTAREFSEDFAEVHSMPQQRAYNLLCMAYGADPKLFGDVVSKGYLPKERAATCEEEYEQVQDAFETLVRPHIDPELAEKTLDRTWLLKPPAQSPRPGG